MDPNIVSTRPMGLMMMGRSIDGTPLAGGKESADSSPTRGPHASVRHRRGDVVGNRQSLASMYAQRFASTPDKYTGDRDVGQGGFGAREEISMDDGTRDDDDRYGAEENSGTFESAKDGLSQGVRGGWNISAFDPERRNATMVKGEWDVVQPKGQEVGKGGGAVKIGRREAWLRFLAHEACMEICIEALLSLSSDEERRHAHGLVEMGCRVLKDGLGVTRLVLDDAGGKDGKSIYWDDVDNVAGAGLPKSFPGQPRKQGLAGMRNTESPAKSAFCAHQLIQDTRGVDQDDDANAGRIEKERYISDYPLSSVDYLSVPYVEAAVVRIVGSPYFESFGEMNHDTSVDDEAVQHHVLMYISGHKKTFCSQNTLGSTGGIISSRPLQISSKAGKMVYVDLQKDGRVVASGSVMISELQRLAARSDALGQEPPSSFFKQLITPSGWRRKDFGGSMIWIKMTSLDGSQAGHVVLSAKALPGDTPLTGALAEGGSAPASMQTGNKTLSMTKDLAAPKLSDGSEQGFLKAWNNNPLHIEDYESGNTSPKSDEEEPAQDKFDSQAGIQTRAGTTGGYLQVNSRHVYDILLDCSLRASGCDKPGSSMALHGQWDWLCSRFCSKYGIRQEYAVLVYLRWILEKHIVKPNSKCFDVIQAKYSVIKEANSKAGHGMHSNELALLSQVRQDIKRLLTQAFENYFALQEDYSKEVNDVVLNVRSPDASVVLQSAMRLLLLVFGGDENESAKWASHRLRKGSSQRFYSILAAVESKMSPFQKEKKDDGTSNAFRKVSEVCSAIVEEIRADEGIQKSGVLLHLLHLPYISSLEYIKGFRMHLKSTLSSYPPRKPSSDAINLVKSVGNLQNFLERHNYLDASVHLNAYEIFREYILRWIASCGRNLKKGVNIIDDESGPAKIHNWTDLRGSRPVVPLVEALIRQMEKDMSVYRPLVCFWPVFATELEGTLVDVMRVAVSVASRHCGLIQSEDNEQHIRHGKDAVRRRIAWRWTPVDEAHDPESVTDALRKGSNVQQALLLNTLRRLLAVVPQLESTLSDWCHTIPVSESQCNDIRASLATFPNRVDAKDKVAEEAPELGAQWAQLVKELRTEYYACITLTAESISKEIFSSASTSTIEVLRRGGGSSSSSAIVKRVEKSLSRTAPTIRILASVLDGRVFVALSRGLWDLTARQILHYAEDLREGGKQSGHAWKGRQNAAQVLGLVDNFYKDEISAAMGSDLQSKDASPPQHSRRAGALLAANTAQLDTSFDVY